MSKLASFLSGVLLVVAGGLSAACHHPASASATPAAAEVVSDPTLAPTQHPEDAMPRVKVEDAKAEVAKGTAVLIDVRGTESYKVMHIQDALDYSLLRLEQSDFKDLPQGKRIIAYCTCPTEHSSARAALLLQKAGYKEAGALLGGVSAWEAAGGEVFQAPPASPGAAPNASSGNAATHKPEAKAKASKKS